jgi:hypothetical protein
VVQIRVTAKTRSPFTFKALSISGVTWNWHVLNHAGRGMPAVCWAAKLRTALTRPVHERAVDLYDRIIHDQVAVEVPMQRLGIDLLAFGVDLSRKVMDAQVVLFKIGPQCGFYPLPLDRCHVAASLWLVALVTHVGNLF